MSESELPTKFGDFTISAFEEPNGKDHIALTIGDIHNQDVCFDCCPQAILLFLHS